MRSFLTTARLEALKLNRSSMRRQALDSLGTSPQVTD
jgi:hypothetical protein